MKRVIATGGDAKAVASFEYRIPLNELFTLALFHDMGLNRILFRDDAGVSLSQVALLNATFPDARFSNEPNIAAGSQRVRMSSGVEIQFLPPRLCIPLRVFAAVNPLTYRGTPEAIAFDRSYFPNQASIANAFRAFGPRTLADRRFLIRFSIGRTF